MVAPLTSSTICCQQFHPKLINVLKKQNHVHLKLVILLDHEPVATFHRSSFEVKEDHAHGIWTQCQQNSIFIIVGSLANNQARNYGSWQGPRSSMERHRLLWLTVQPDYSSGQLWGSDSTTRSRLLRASKAAAECGYRQTARRPQQRNQEALRLDSDITVGSHHIKVFH